MAGSRIGRVVGTTMVAACVCWAQQPKKGVAAPAPPTFLAQPDAQRTRAELSNLLQRYPPTVRSVLSMDPSLLNNETYLEPYNALGGFLKEHPEIARNPSFYIGESWFPRPQVRDPATEVMENVLGGVAAFAGFGMGIGLLAWLIRTLVDYKRWSRLARVQTDAHTKLLDRFTANEDLLAYIQSPAGARFLESSPIRLDAGTRGMAAPLGRILWSIQGGVVLIAGGFGLEFVSNRLPGGVAEPLRTLGVLGIALGVGFVISAIISFAISKRLGLIEGGTAGRSSELPGS